MAYASLTITSAHQGARLRVEPDPTTRERWVVTLTSDPLSATLRFWDHERTGLDRYFADLAEAWRGWTGEKRWDALEGDVTLRAVHDGRGHITLTVELSEYREPAWSCSADLVLEPAMLTSIAREARSID